MIRIIGGKFKGKKLRFNHKSGMRPTKDMAKEAIFNILQCINYHKSGACIFQNAIILDVFCGSGALALEAISRGAKKAYLIDNEKCNMQIARENAVNLNVENDVTFIITNALCLPQAIEPCDLVFIDPPYHSNLFEKSFRELLLKKWLKKGTIVVYESDAKEYLKNLPDFSILDTRKYGNSKFYLLEIL